MSHATDRAELFEGPMRIRHVDPDAQTDAGTTRREGAPAWVVREPRWDWSVEVDISLSGHVVQARVENISMTGAYVKTELPLEVDDQFRLGLPLPEGVLWFAVLVVWSRRGTEQPAGVGVRFVSPTLIDRSLLRVQIDRLAELKPEQATYTPPC